MHSAPSAANFGTQALSFSLSFANWRKLLASGLTLGVENKPDKLSDSCEVESTGRKLADYCKVQQSLIPFRTRVLVWITVQIKFSSATVSMEQYRATERGHMSSGSLIPFRTRV